MIEKEINSIDELLQFVMELNAKHGLRLWYRGVANSAWPLLPSIQRTKHRIESERYITNDFYIKAKQVLDDCPEKKNYSAWMSIMQHYGLPTRLLDWSQSPLISTFFAVEKYKDFPQTNACIWVLAPGKLNETEGFGNCIYPVDADTVQNMLLPAFKENGHVAELSNKIIACHSTENNLRMYSQQANFTIHNSLKRLEDICDENTLYKIIIPAKIREYFLYSLEIFGITESFVYPDLDHIAHDLKRAYNILYIDVLFGHCTKSLMAPDITKSTDFRKEVKVEKPSSTPIYEHSSNRRQGHGGNCPCSQSEKYKRKQKPYPPRYPNWGHL